MSRRWALVALAALGLLLAAGTLGPPPAELIHWVVRGAHRKGADEVSYSLVESAANLALFVPAGFLLAAARPRLSGWLVWAVCVGGSIAVELAQTLLPDRVPSLRDVALNSAGAGLGVLIHAVAGHRRERSAHD
jgi:hypothetical protein